MDFIDQIRALSSRIEKQIDVIETEEATKSAMVLPFISALGYDIFDPTEVVPEFTADVGTKKGEKVDYAILRDGKPIMLFECKWCGTDLDDTHASQLFRYFTVTDARIAVLTNGILYRFYSDLEKANQMDSKPFLEFNILDIQEPLVNELKKLTKSAFDLDEMLSTASDLKYTREIKLFLSDQLKDPKIDFVKFLASKVYPGRLTKQTCEQFTDIVRRAFKQFVNEQINDRLKSAMSEEKQEEPKEQQPDQAEEEKSYEDRIVTTEEELEGFYIVKAILRDIVDLKRVTYRDRIHYFGILLDNNGRKPICRLYFNTSRKYIAFFDNDKKEEKVHISDLNDIYKYADRIRAMIPYYDQQKA